VTFGSYARFVWEIDSDEENDEKGALIEVQEIYEQMHEAYSIRDINDSDAHLGWS
ncbi:hypothetical protein Tco_1328350, partial [Tanacetum coccineum]